MSFVKVGFSEFKWGYAALFSPFGFPSNSHFLVTSPSWGYVDKKKIIDTCGQTDAKIIDISMLDREMDIYML